LINKVYMRKNRLVCLINYLFYYLSKYVVIFEVFKKPKKYTCII